MGQPGPSPRRSCVQVPPGPQAEPEGLGQGHTAPFPRGPRVHSLPRARGQACSPLPRTQAALPMPTRLAAFGEELGPHRNHLAPMVRGRKSGKRTLAMITGSPLHMGRGLLSFLAPTPRCSAFCTRPVAGSARLGSKKSWVPGCRRAGSLRPVSFMLILVQRPSFSPQDQPWDLSSGSLLLL